VAGHRTVGLLRTEEGKRIDRLTKGPRAVLHLRPVRRAGGRASPSGVIDGVVKVEADDLATRTSLAMEQGPRVSRMGPVAAARGY
jgi:hypothetical protein